MARKKIVTLSDNQRQKNEEILRRLAEERRALIDEINYNIDVIISN